MMTETIRAIRPSALEIDHIYESMQRRLPLWFQDTPQTPLWLGRPQTIRHELDGSAVLTVERLDIAEGTGQSLPTIVLSRPADADDTELESIVALVQEDVFTRGDGIAYWNDAGVDQVGAVYDDLIDSALRLRAILARREAMQAGPPQPVIERGHGSLTIRETVRQENVLSTLTQTRRASLSLDGEPVPIQVKTIWFHDDGSMELDFVLDQEAGR